MTVAHERVAAGQTSAKDRLNRDIAQDAGTDRELESNVPPVSKSGTIWRIAVAAGLLLALLAGIVLSY